MKILIAEDDLVSRRMLEAVLTKWDYKVISAKDGDEAWRILQEQDAPRLVILDWMMPGKDGLQICRAIRKQRAEPYTYILLLTGKTNPEDIITGMEAGADDYIRKPFNTDELKVRLRAGRRILDLQSELLSVREALREQATHDPLTGLPNRLLFSDRLTQSIAQAKRRNQMLAVMFLDLDRFKIINDTLGHNIGDQLLTQVAVRLQRDLREVDTIARMGGDEFTLILTDIKAEKDVEIVAKRVLSTFADAFILNGRDVYVSTSIGISLFPNDGDDIETLVKNADSAMYSAKEQGRNMYYFYSGLQETMSERRLMLDSSLRNALDHEEFTVHYQARVDLKSGRILGAEALVRWEHPELGLIQPNDFISIAEQNGTIIPLTDYILQTACTQNKNWQEAGLMPMDVTVNISGTHIKNGSIVESVKNALTKSGLDPEYLCLEVTEAALLANPDIAIPMLSGLKDTGVKVILDDFGTGHSSLNCLKQFVVNAVKIDRSFIKDITADPDDAAIAGAIIAMAHSLKLKVIAEGVETLEQLEFLRSLNCDEMQGYFISRPVPADEFTHLLWSARQSAINGVLKVA